MATLELHLEKYRAFKASAAAAGVAAEAKVELLFLAAYQIIDACAAKKGAHINKHQNVRQELQKNTAILGAHTTKVWRAFRELQGESRSRIVYGAKWTAIDLHEAEDRFQSIESKCLEVLK